MWLYYQELEKEKEENKRLEKLIEERDRRIAELERDMALMNKVCYMYCKFNNFRKNFIFTNSVKRHICDNQNLRQWHDLHISVNDRVISPYREDFIITKLKPSRKFPNLQY